MAVTGIYTYIAGVIHKTMSIFMKSFFFSVHTMTILHCKIMYSIRNFAYW